MLIQRQPKPYHLDIDSSSTQEAIILDAFIDPCLFKFENEVLAR
jgi:hypothetical protein